MPRIVVTSDLHYDVNPHTPMTGTATLEALVSAMGALQPDAVLIAGDIGCSFNSFREALKLFHPFVQAKVPVGVVAGNHDVWSHEFSSLQLFSEVLPTTVSACGCVWLERGNLYMGSTAIVGTIAWYDYSSTGLTFDFPPEFYFREKRKFNADAQYVDWPFSDIAFAKQVRESLVTRLQEAEDNKDITAIFVVTHVPCFDSQLVYKPADYKWSFTNAYFGHKTLGNALAAFGKVRWVVSGHTHRKQGGVHYRSDGSCIQTAVIGSSYGAPVFEVFDLKVNADE